MLKSLRWLVAGLIFCALSAHAATLLPNGKQSFFDANGNPISGGTVQFYVPGTTTPKDTYQDAGGTVLNSNPVTLDSSGQAVIYGTGAYREIVKDSAGNLIWDQLTADTAASSVSWGGRSTGSANSQIVNASNFTSADGQVIAFIAGFTNTTALSVNGVNVLKDTSGGAISLTGGEVQTGNDVQLQYDSTRGAFHMVSFPTPALPMVSLASAATTDLGTVSTRNVNITGTVAITSFGSTASTSYPFYRIKFAGALTLTYNATSLILPGGTNIITAAGDYADALYLGSGNWQVVNYQTASGLPVISPTLYALPSASGLVVQNNATTPNTKIDVTASAAIITTTGGQPSYWGGGTLTCDLGTTGANGLDTGTKANSTWYHVYIEYNPTTLATACLASLSATAPALTAGYTARMRVGAMYVDSSGNLMRTQQRGRQARYVVTPTSNTTAIPTLGSGTASTWTAVSTSTVIPTTATQISIRCGSTAHASSGQLIACAPNSNYVSFSSAPLFMNDPGSGVIVNISMIADFILESSNVYWASTMSGGFIACFGWTDSVNAN